jgi:hypothetical protein
MIKLEQQKHLNKRIRIKPNLNACPMKGGSDDGYISLSRK